MCDPTHMSFLFNVFFLLHDCIIFKTGANLRVPNKIAYKHIQKQRVYACAYHIMTLCAYLNLRKWGIHFYDFLLKVVIMITLDSSIEMEFFVSDESPYFSHYACEILHATDIAKVIRENVEKVQKFL